MHPPAFPRRRPLLLLLAGCAAATGWAAQAEAQQREPLAIRKIMQDLGSDMEQVTRGISREDWALVARTAPRIARHPQPPLSEKVKILSWLGPDAGKFRAYDEAVHRHGLELEKAAQAQDGRGAIAAFANLQGSCLACHQAYRAGFAEHFHGKR